MCKPSLPSSSENDVTGQDDQERRVVTRQSSPLVKEHPRRRQRQVWNLRQRSCLAAFACLQNALVGGLVFGWASIDRTLLVADRSHGGTGLTPLETTTIFSWASSIAMLSSLLMGLVLDRCGPRTASVASNGLVGLGCWLFSRADTFGGFAAGTCMMAFGGPGISSAIVHIANLFPRNQFLVMSCLCGSITFSFSILAIFGDLWEQYDLGFRTLFGGYVVVIMGSTVGSLCCWPDVPFVKEDSDAYYENSSSDTDATIGEEEEPLITKTTTCTISAEQEYVEATLEHHRLCEEPLDTGLRQKLAYGRSQSFLQSVQALAVSDQEPAAKCAISLKDQPFWNQVLSKTYLRNLLIFIITSFFVNFTIASISTELADQQVFSVETQHDLSRSFTFVMSGGLLGSILVGWWMDRVGLEACTIVTLMLGQASLVLRILSRTSPVMVVGFVVYTLFRQFLFPVFIACLTARLGFKYFGILSGIGFALSGTVQVFMASLVHRLAGNCHLQQPTAEGTAPTSCHHGTWTQFHVFQIVLLGVLILIPIVDQREAANREKSMASFVRKVHGTEGKGRRKMSGSVTASPLQDEKSSAASYGSLLVV